MVKAVKRIVDGFRKSNDIVYVDESELALYGELYYVH